MDELRRDRLQGSSCRRPRIHHKCRPGDNRWVTRSTSLPRPATCGRTSNAMLLQVPCAFSWLYYSSGLSVQFCARVSGKTKVKAALAAARPVNDLIDDAVFLGLLGVHDEVAFYVALNAIERLACVFCHQGVGDFADAKNLTRVNVDVLSLAAKTAHGRLVNQDA